MKETVIYKVENLNKNTQIKLDKDIFDLIEKVGFNKGIKYSGGQFWVTREGFSLALANFVYRAYLYLNGNKDELLFSYGYEHECTYIHKIYSNSYINNEQYFNFTMEGLTVLLQNGTKQSLLQYIENNK